MMYLSVWNNKKVLFQESLGLQRAILKLWLPVDGRHSQTDAFCDNSESKTSHSHMFSPSRGKHALQCSKIGFFAHNTSHQYAVTWTTRLLDLKNSLWWKPDSVRLTYGKVLVYFLIFQLQAAATHLLCTVLHEGRGMLAFLHFTMCKTSAHTHKNTTKCMLLGEKRKKKNPAVKTVDKKRPKCAQWLAVILWL